MSKYKTTKVGVDEFVPDLPDPRKVGASQSLAASVARLPRTAEVYLPGHLANPLYSKHLPVHALGLSCLAIGHSTAEMQRALGKTVPLQLVGDITVVRFVAPSVNTITR